MNEGIKCLRSKCDASSSMDFEHYQRHIPLLNRVVILFCWIFFVEEGIFFKGCPCILLVHVGCKGASRCLEERKGGGGGGLSMCSWPSVACGSAEKAASGTANSWILHEGKKQVKTVIQRQKDVTLLSYLTERESKIACITSMFQCPLGRVLCRMSMKLTKLKYTVTNHMHPSLWWFISHENYLSTATSKWKTEVITSMGQKCQKSCNTSGCNCHSNKFILSDSFSCSFSTIFWPKHHDVVIMGLEWFAAKSNQGSVEAYAWGWIIDFRCTHESIWSQWTYNKGSASSFKQW